MLASLVAVSVGGALVARIPHLLEQRRLARTAATEARMYHLRIGLEEYRSRYGAYPERLSDLARLEGMAPDSSDSWSQKIAYTGYTGDLAAKGRVSTVNTKFDLRSAGADGVLNTEDDVLMRDGILIDPLTPSPLSAAKRPAPIRVSKPAAPRPKR